MVFQNVKRSLQRSNFVGFVAWNFGWNSGWYAFTSARLGLCTRHKRRSTRSARDSRQIEVGLVAPFRLTYKLPDGYFKTNKCSLLAAR